MLNYNHDSKIPYRLNFFSFDDCGVKKIKLNSIAIEESIK